MCSNFDKPYFPVEDMIKKLKNKNLSIPNEPFLTMLLNEFGYNRLINGYKRPFICKTQGNAEIFKSGTTIDDLYLLYTIDNSFREIFLINVLPIDSHIGTLLGNLIAKNYNVNDHDKNDPSNPDSTIPSYLSSKNYIDNGYARGTLKYIRHNILEKTKDNPTAYYRKNKNHVPPWILVQNIPFGALIKFYKIQKPCIKNEIISSIFPCDKSKDLGLEKQIFLSAAEILISFRNTAAHSSPIYLNSSKLDNNISKKTLMKYLGTGILLDSDNINYLSHNKLYVALLSLILLASNISRRKLMIHSLERLDKSFKCSNDLNDRKIYSLYLEYAELPVDFINRLKDASTYLLDLEKRMQT